MDITQLFSNRRRVIIGLLGVVLLCIVGYFAFHGLVIITSNGDAAITITQRSNATNTQRSTGGFWGGVPSGDVHITAITPFGAREVSQHITPFSITILHMDVKKATETQYVTNIPSLDLQATASRLHFLATDTNRLIRVDENGSFMQYDTPVNIYQVVWSGEGVGIASGHDGKNYVLLAVQDGTVQEIPLPEQVPTTNLSLGASASKYYLIQNSKLYSSPKDRIAFTYLASLLPNAAIVTASDSLLVYTETEGNSGRFIVYHTGSKRSYNVAMLMSETPETAMGAQISPDEKRIIINDSGVATIYDTILTPLDNLPYGATGQAIWKNNTEIIYAGERYIWQYDSGTKAASAIGITPNFVKPLHLYTDTSSRYLYFDGLSGTYFTTFRLPLQGTPTDDAVATAALLGESNMNELETGCVVHYVHFTKTTLATTGQFAGLASCRKSVENYLSSITIKPDSVVRQQY